MKKDKTDKPVQTSAQAEKNKAASLEDVLPKKASVKLNGGREITFTEFKIADLNKVYSILTNADLTKLLNSGGITPMSIMAAVEWNDLVKLLSISSGEPEDAFSDITVIEALEIVEAFCRANFGFFVFNFKSIASTVDLVEKAVPILNETLR